MLYLLVTIPLTSLVAQARGEDGEVPMTSSLNTPDPNAPAIEIRQLHKSFKSELEVLKGIDLTIDRGEVVCVIGPSGSGEVHPPPVREPARAPDRWLHPHRGHRHLDPDVDLDSIRARIGMVFRQFNLFPHMTVLRNFTIAQEKVLGRKPAESQKIARDMLERVGLSDKVDAHPAQLSGDPGLSARGHRPLSVDEPGHDALRQATSALDPGSWARCSRS